MQTRNKVFGVTCPSCGHEYETEMNTAVFASTTDREKLLTGSFASLTCPSCGHEFILNYRFVYTDEDVKFMIVNDPKFVCVQNRLAFKSSLSILDPSRKSEQDKYLTRMTTDIEEVREKMAIFEAYLSDKAIEILKYMLLESDELSLNHDDVVSFRYTPQNNFLIKTADEEEYRLAFVREVYDKIVAQYDGMFETDKAQLIDKNWAYDFLKNK